MIAYEREFLKVQDKIEQLIENVREAGREQWRVDEVERMLIADLLELGLQLLKAFVAGAGGHARQM